MISLRSILDSLRLLCSDSSHSHLHRLTTLPGARLSSPCQTPTPFRGSGNRTSSSRRAPELPVAVVSQFCRATVNHSSCKHSEPGQAKLSIPTASNNSVSSCRRLLHPMQRMKHQTSATGTGKSGKDAFTKRRL